MCHFDAFTRFVQGKKFDITLTRSKSRENYQLNHGSIKLNSFYFEEAEEHSLFFVRIDSRALEGIYWK